MDQAVAREFRCGNCGGQLAWDATSRALKCANCGSAEPVHASGAVVEHDLFSNWNSAQKGIGTAARTIACRECGASVSFPAGTVSGRCTFCGSPSVLEQHANQGLLRPESLVPFAIDKRVANYQFGKWIRGLWFRPSALARMATVQEVNGVYVPFWTYDADVDSDWQAQRGRYYYVEESYVANENGQSVTRSRQVRHTRWEPASGRRRDSYDDLLVCASRGLPDHLADEFATFNTKLLVPYAPGYLAGWRAEEYAVDLQAGWRTAEGRIQREQERRCKNDVGGDEVQYLTVNNQIRRATFKHVLLPVWLAAYRYQGKVYRFLVNGQTGEVVGKAPWSVVKILAFVVFLAALIGGIIFLANR